MIIDAGVHYVEPETPERPYAAKLNQEIISAEQLIADAIAAGIDRVVQVTPSFMGYDNQYALEGAQANRDRVIGVFGRFDPVSPGLEDRLAEFMAQDTMMGVRIQCRPGEPSLEWLRQKALDPFFAVAEKRKIPIACFAPNQPREIKETVRRFPGLRLINEHLSFVNMDGKADTFAHWADILVLAKEPNVWSQVSYFPEAAPRSEKYPFPTSQKHFRELYEHVGASRMLWAGHYPTVRNVCTYREAVDFIRKSEFVSAADRDAILGGNFLATFVR